MGRRGVDEAGDDGGGGVVGSRWRHVWIGALSGFLAGVSNSISVSFLSPLDVLKIRFQTQGEMAKLTTTDKTYRSLSHGLKTIAEREGIRGWFKGLSVSVLRELTFSSTRYGLYEPIRNLLSRQLSQTTPTTPSPSTSPPQTTTLHVKVLAGLISGAMAAAIFNPTDVLKIRFQADAAPTKELRAYHSIYDAVVKIIRTEGLIGGLYKGVHITIVRAALLTSAQLATYDHSKHALIHYLHFKDSFPAHFCASFVSGFAAALVTNPVDVIRTRTMNERNEIASKTDRKYQGIVRSFVKIAKHEGVLGLYKGFAPNYLRLGSCTVAVFVLYEQLRILFGIPTI
eukprot:TRINITY_DN4881_c0_g5_i1.p1 TRINITY_DN4881_c0_g5~~TRINITY_DN4881_c0_g5_i1.p1  ORF type:complete len:341 (+),score=72.07 TRINITY_DN4881_c0_g5_i1:48-1070(+)